MRLGHELNVNNPTVANGNSKPKCTILSGLFLWFWSVTVAARGCGQALAEDRERRHVEPTLDHTPSLPPFYSRKIIKVRWTHFQNPVKSWDALAVIFRQDFLFNNDKEQ